MPESKVVTVGYGLLNRPNKQIEKTINKWGAKGYRLVSRQDSTPGCLAMLFSFGWARGKAELTFIKDD